MFIRQKRNKSGRISVQVIDKSNGYRVVKTLGAARDPDEIDEEKVEQSVRWDGLKGYLTNTALAALPK